MSGLIWEIDFSGLIGAQLSIVKRDGMEVNGILEDVEWQEFKYNGEKALFPKTLRLKDHFEVPMIHIVEISTDGKKQEPEVNPDRLLSPEEIAKLPRHRQPTIDTDKAKKLAAQKAALEARKKGKKVAPKGGNPKRSAMSKNA